MLNQPHLVEETLTYLLVRSVPPLEIRAGAIRGTTCYHKYMPSGDIFAGAAVERDRIICGCAFANGVASFPRK